MGRGLTTPGPAHSDGRILRCPPGWEDGLADVAYCPEYQALISRVPGLIRADALGGAGPLCSLLRASVHVTLWKEGRTRV